MSTLLKLKKKIRKRPYRKEKKNDEKFAYVSSQGKSVIKDGVEARQRKRKQLGACHNIMDSKN